MNRNALEIGRHDVSSVLANVRARRNYARFGSTRDSPAASAARQPYIRNRTNLRPVDGPKRRMTMHVAADPEASAHACQLGVEGIVSKRIDRTYRSARYPVWIEVRDRVTQRTVESVSPTKD
jgi:hypothetical protein